MNQSAVAHPGEALQFSKQTTTFKLTGKISPAQFKLVLTLEDYANQTVYGKEFTNQNVGRQIHVNVDLQFIYDSLCFTDLQDSSPTLNKNAQKYDIIPNYKFGTVIKTNGIPSYKVDVGGVIYVYRTLLDLKTKKQISYQSILKLQKIRNMTELQILNQKLKIQKSQGQIAKRKQEQELVKHMTNSKNLKLIYVILLTLLIGVVYNFIIQQRNLSYFKKHTNSEFLKIKSQYQTKLANQIQKTDKIIEQMNIAKQKLQIIQKFKIHYGKSNEWTLYNQNQSKITIKYQHLGLTKIPQIFTSLHGTSSIWGTTGATSIYSATNTQFDVYIKNMSPTQMAEFQVYLHYQIIPQEQQVL